MDKLLDKAPYSDNKIGDKMRVKDVQRLYEKHYNGLSPNMQNFLVEYTTTTGRVLDLTSGKRGATGAGKLGKHSHHFTGDAIDISEKNIEDYSYLMNTKEGLSLLSRYNLGVIDETDPETMKKTGATGAHFHIGKDTNYAKLVRERLRNFDNENEIVPVVTEDTNHFIGDGHSHEEGLTQDVEREMEKSVITENKDEEVPERRELKEEQNQFEVQREIEEEFSKILRQSSNEPNLYSEPVERNFAIVPDLNIQRSLPEIPTIFNN